MESCSQLYIRKIVDSILHNLKQRHNNIIFVKYYNTLNLREPELREAFETQDDDIFFLYHEFSAKYMQGAFEPFLDWIMELYQRFYSDVTIDEFLEKAGVYFQARSVIKSYIETGECQRDEDMIFVECEYEEKRFTESVYNILSYISKEHTLFMLLNKLHFAEQSTIKLLIELVKHNKENIAFLANYNEVYNVPEYTKKDWNTMIDYIDSHNMIVDWSLQDGHASESERVELFDPVPKDLNTYIRLINNMVSCVMIGQANYYLEQIHNKFEVEKITIPLKDKLSYLKLYSTVALCLDNSTTALMLCDNINNSIKKTTSPEEKFSCAYISALAQFKYGQKEVANRYIQKCFDLADEINDEEYGFKAKLLDYIITLHCWKNIYSWDVNLIIDHNFAKDAMKYKYYNHLAYIYLFGTCNDILYFVNGASGIEEAESFKLGMALAKMLNNESLMIKAWQKNVMMASSYGYFSSVDYFYKKTLEIIEGQNNKFEEANTYNGLGYNRIVSEKYDIANEYFNKALAILYELDNPHMVCETLYNMATNAILAHEYYSAITYLTIVIDILEALDEHKLRICNLGKIYGFLVLCNCYLGIEYNANLYFSKLERAVSHMLNKPAESSFYLWDDDMFFYFFTAGLIAKDDNIEKAQKYFDRAKIHLFRSAGNLFFAYYQFAIAQADLYDVQGRHDDAIQILNEALEFCETHSYKFKAEILRAKLEGRPFPHEKIELKLESVTQKQLEAMSRRCRIEHELARKNKGINFLISWQDLLNKDYSTDKELVNNAMNNIQNSYNIDYTLFIEMKNDSPIVSYQSKSLNLTAKDIETITNFFLEYRKEFITSRFDKTFNDYDIILNIFGKINVSSLMCIPMYNNEVLQGVMVAIVKVHENMLSNIYFFGSTELIIFKFAAMQIMDAVERLNAKIEIKAINAKLQKSSVTDLLTGLLNRQGFAKKLEDFSDYSTKQNFEEQETTVLYIDLDNFKYCNDTFGHDIGDLMLKKLSSLFTEIVGEKGYCVRYGGDEFIIVLPDASTEFGISISKQIYTKIEENGYFINDISAALKRPIEIDKEHRISCSIGISTTQKYNQESIMECLRHADSALYDIKKGTKHNFKVWKTVD